MQPAFDQLPTQKIDLDVLRSTSTEILEFYAAKNVSQQEERLLSAIQGHLNRLDDELQKVPTDFWTPEASDEATDASLHYQQHRRCFQTARDRAQGANMSAVETAETSLQNICRRAALLESYCKTMSCA